MSGIALLTTEGGAHARGLAHGRRFAAEIADNIATYLRRFAASGLDRDQAFAEAARWRKAIAVHDGDYAEEMRGIADGSGHSEDTIALLNARYELAFTLFGQEARTAARTVALVGPGGCTTFALLPQATADRHTWLGQNWDWLAGVHGRTFVLRARRTAQPSFVCLTEAGIAGGKMGVNEMRDRARRERSRLKPRREQSLSKAVPRALPGGAGRGAIRRGGATGDRLAAHLLGQFRDRRREWRDREHRIESRPRQPDRSRRGRRHPFQPFPHRRTRGVTVGKDCPQHALSRRSHAGAAAGAPWRGFFRAYALGRRRPCRRAVCDLPPSRCKRSRASGAR
jgi:hypothetical protein